MTDIWKLKTIQEALDYCKKEASNYREDLTREEKEITASRILSFSFGDHFTGWRDAYPIVDEIQALASDLEWSNSSDVDEDWEKLLTYIKQLDKEVNGT